jgi:SOS-response transcriptional repressor LexA
MAKPITERQLEVLRKIQLLSGRGTPPTLKELRRALKVASDQGVIELVDRLIAGGYLRKDVGQARGIFLTPKAQLKLGPSTKGTDEQSAHAFRLKPMQRRVYEGLLRIDPRLARAYEGGLRVLLDRSNPESVSQSAHSMREIGMMLARKAGEPREAAKDERSNQASAFSRKIWKVLDPRGGTTELKTVYDIWNDEFQVFFTKVAHHSDGEEVPREAYDKKLAEFDELLRYVLAFQTEIYQEIDVIIKKGSVNAHPQRLAFLIRRNVESYGYFFRNADASWLDFLKGNSLLTSTWEVGQYLLKVAAEKPQEVMEVVLKMKADPMAWRIRDAMVMAAAKMPPGIAAKIVPKIVRQEHWLENTPGHLHDLLLHSLNDLIKTLIPGEKYSEVLSLTHKMLEVKVTVDPTTKRAIDRPMDSYYYGEIIKTLHTLPDEQTGNLAKVLREKLCEAIAVESPERDEEDYSHIWRPAIEANRQNWGHENTKEILVTALRDFLERHVALLINTGAADIPKKIDAILANKIDYAILKRLRLHVYRLHVAEFKKEIPAELLRNEEDSDLWHEYFLLLQAAFPHLLPSFQRSYIARLLKKKPRNIRKDMIPYWRARRLVAIKDYLPGGTAKRFESMLSKFDEEDAAFTIRHESFHGPTSPLTEEEMEKNTIEQLVERFIAWEPASDIFSPSRGGLGMSFANVIKKQPDLYLEKTAVFKNLKLRPVFFYHLFGALREVLHKRGDRDWSGVVDLADYLVKSGQKGSLTVFDDPKEREADWNDVFQSIAHFLSDGLQFQEYGFKKEDDGKIWNCIQFLCQNEDPTPEREKQYMEGNFDPYGLSINTARGQAFHALIMYIFWVNRNTKDAKRFIPEGVKKILEEHLDISRDSSLAVRSVYGRFFPWLYSHDHEWVMKMAPRIFPDDHEELWYAAWEGYLFTFFGDVYRRFRSLYEKAIEKITVPKPNRRYHVDPVERLGEHVMIGLAHGYDEADVIPLYEKFFAKANPKQRGDAISFAGRHWIVRDQIPEGERLTSMKPLEKFWEWRLKNSNSPEELREFGWWVKQGVFDDPWMLDRLIQTLEKTEGDVDGEFKVMQALAELADKYPLACAKVISLVTRSRVREKVIFHTNEDEIGQALKKIYASKNKTAIELADGIVDHLTKLGLERFRYIKTPAEAEKKSQ